MFTPEDSKYIHLIWLGPKPFFDKYLQSVEKYCPTGFKIHIWKDEDLIPLCQRCNYFRRNYALKNYAFASDYARFKILYEYGGMYIDTDVEFINPIEDCISFKKPFFASETISNRITSGLIMYCPGAKNEAMKFVVEYYEKSSAQYIRDGEILSKSLEPYGYVWEDKYQVLLDGTIIYKGGIFDWNEFSDTSKIDAKAIHHYTHLY